MITSVSNPPTAFPDAPDTASKLAEYRDLLTRLGSVEAMRSLRDASKTNSPDEMVVRVRDDKGAQRAVRVRLPRYELLGDAVDQAHQQVRAAMTRLSLAEYRRAWQDAGAAVEEEWAAAQAEAAAAVRRLWMLEAWSTRQRRTEVAARHEVIQEELAELAAQRRSARPEAARIQTRRARHLHADLGGLVALPQAGFALVLQEPSVQQSTTAGQGGGCAGSAANAMRHWARGLLRRRTERGAQVNVRR